MENRYDNVTLIEVDINTGSLKSMRDRTTETVRILRLLGARNIRVYVNSTTGKKEVVAARYGNLQEPDLADYCAAVNLEPDTSMSIIVEGELNEDQLITLSSLHYISLPQTNKNYRTIYLDSIKAKFQPKITK